MRLFFDLPSNFHYEKFSFVWLHSTYLDSAEILVPVPFHKLTNIHTYSTDIRVNGTMYDDKKNDI